MTRAIQVAGTAPVICWPSAGWKSMASNNSSFRPPTPKRTYSPGSSRAGKRRLWCICKRSLHRFPHDPEQPGEVFQCHERISRCTGRFLREYFLVQEGNLPGGLDLFYQQQRACVRASFSDKGSPQGHSTSTRGLVPTTELALLR